jgi:DNA-binding NarL/FixJ family response regulator
MTAGLRPRALPASVANAAARSPGARPLPLSDREKAILRLLARGVTDEATARHLGLSKRTVSYTVSGLMRRVGAANRFQLGLLLGAAYSPPVTA